MLLCGREATSRLEVSLLCSQEGLSRGPLGGKRPARGHPQLGEECGRALGDLPRLPAHAPTPPTSLTSQGRGTPGRTGHALWLEGPLRARKGLPLRHREVWVGRRTRLCPAWGVGRGGGVPDTAWGPAAWQRASGTFISETHSACRGLSRPGHTPYQPPVAQEPGSLFPSSLHWPL